MVTITLHRDRWRIVGASNGKIVKRRHKPIDRGGWTGNPDGRRAAGTKARKMNESLILMGACKPCALNALRNINRKLTH